LLCGGDGVVGAAWDGDWHHGVLELDGGIRSAVWVIDSDLDLRFCPVSSFIV
jgi:hypothetical protein